ncbi:MAG: nitronate monooxygenase [Thermoleophilia bacterium]
MQLPELVIGRHRARLPIIQGGMSVRVSTSSLAAAVAEAGGIGTIGGSGIPPDELAEDIRLAKRLTSGVIAVNIMFAIRDFVDTVKASLEAGVDLIATGAGFSRDIFKLAREYDVPVISIVSSAKFAQLAERSGAAAVVLEATEAGGHLGTMEKLRDLFPQVREAVKKVPLIAAGGLTNGYEIAELIGRYGADGVQMATRFVLTDECTVADSYKQAYLKAGPEDVVLMDSPVGLPGRAIRTPLIEKLEAGEKIADRCPFTCLKRCSRSFCINDRLELARTGDIDEGLVFAGSNVWKCRDIVPVAELMDRLRREAESVEIS